MDGEPLEEELSEEEVNLRLQRSLAAEKQLKRAQEIQRRLAGFVHGGKENLEEAVKQLFGVDLEQYATQKLAQKFREASLSPEEQARKKLEDERDALRKKLEKEEARRNAESQRQLEEKVWHETEATVLEALRIGGFEKSKAMLHIVADVAEAALDYNLNLTPEQLAAETKRRMQSYVKQTLPGIKGQRLLEFLGEDTVKEILRAEIERRRLAVSTPPPVAQPESNPAEPQARKHMSPSQFRRKHLFGISAQ